MRDSGNAWPSGPSGSGLTQRTAVERQRARKDAETARRRARARIAAPRRAPSRRPPSGRGRLCPAKCRAAVSRHLRGCGEMDEAVGAIDRRAGERAGPLGFAPQAGRADLVDRRQDILARRFTPADRAHINYPLTRHDAGTAIWTNRVFRFLQRRGPLVNRRTTSRGARPMLTHSDIWTAVDRLAARAGLSASGLARKAGLDPTTFNKSKRITPQGRPRWPSTESVAKSLQATGTTIDDFRLRSLPIAAPRADGAADRSGAGRHRRLFRRERLPGRQGMGRDRVSGVDDEHVYALEMSGDRCSRSTATATVIIVSPAAPIRRGDRVVVKTRDGEVMAKELKRSTASRSSCARSTPHTRAHAWRRRRAVDRAHLWASQ